LIPSQVTLIPTFFVFNPPTFIFTFVSISIFNITDPFSLFFFFRSDLNEFTASTSRSFDPETTTFLKLVWFFLLKLKAGKVPFPRNTSLPSDNAETVKGS
jgi:hypothetical protein